MKVLKLALAAMFVALGLAAFAAEWRNDAGVIRTWNVGRLLPYEGFRGQKSFVKEVVLTKADLDDVDVVSSLFNANGFGTDVIYASFTGRLGRPVSVTRSVVNGEKRMDVVLQAANPNSNWAPVVATSGVAIRLYQDGEDVCGSIVSAFGVNDFNLLGYDNVNDLGIRALYKVGNMLSAYPGQTYPGFGIDQLTMSVKAGRGPKTVVHTDALAADEPLTLDTNVVVTIDAASAFAGEKTLVNAVTLNPGSELVYENAADGTAFRQDVLGSGAGITFRQTLSGDEPCVADSGAETLNATVFRGVDIATVTNFVVRGFRCRRDVDTGVNSDRGWQDTMETFYFTNDGTTATCQVEWRRDDKWVFAVCVTLTQSGPNVKATYEGRVGNQWSPYPKFFVSSDRVNLTLTTELPLQLPNPNDLFFGSVAIKGAQLLLSEPPRPEIHLEAGTNGVENARITVDGPMWLAITNSAESTYYQNLRPILPQGGWFVLTNGASMLLDTYSTHFNRTFLPHNANFRVEKDSLLCIRGKIPMEGFFQYDIHGGELRLGGVEGAAGYLNNFFIENLCLWDGARVTGLRPTVGHVGSGFYRVTGTSPSFLESGVVLNKGNDNGGVVRTFTIQVDDVTRDEKVDFHVNGSIKQNDALNLVLKTGAGTMAYNAVNAYGGETQITDGTLLLGVSAALSVTNDVRVIGGVLANAEGVTNELSVLRIEGGAEGLELGANSLLSFASCEIAEPTNAPVRARYRISGELGNRNLRIGTSATLSESVLRRFRYDDGSANGKPVAQDEEGYLFPTDKGVLIIFR